MKGTGESKDTQALRAFYATLDSQGITNLVERSERVRHWMRERRRKGLTQQQRKPKRGKRPHGMELSDARAWDRGEELAHWPPKAAGPCQHRYDWQDTRTGKRLGICRHCGAKRWASRGKVHVEHPVAK